MSCSGLMFSIFLMSPCGQGGGADINEAVAAAVSNPQRPAEDIEKMLTAPRSMSPIHSYDDQSRSSHFE